MSKHCIVTRKNMSIARDIEKPVDNAAKSRILDNSMPIKKKKSTKTAAKKKPAATKKTAPAKKKPAAKKTLPKNSEPQRKIYEPTPIGKGSFKKEMLKRLEQEKIKLLHEVAHKVKQESDSEKFEIGDMYDIASIERERELTLTLGDREREKLFEIEDAIERLSNKDYGLCEECGEPIGEERLRALPFTLVCVECKTKYEKASLLKGRLEEEPALGILEKQEGEEEF